MGTGLEGSAGDSGKREKARLVFFSGNMSHSGGTERVLSVIANGLAGRGYPVSIISLWGGGNSFFPLCDSIHVYWAEKERRRKGIAGNLHYLTAVLKHERPDFLIDVDSILGCYSFFLKRRFPAMYWVSWEHFHYYHHFQRNRHLRKIIRRIVGRCADWLIVLTEEDKQCYQKKLKFHCRISRIYNPVPYERTIPKKKEFPFIFAAGGLTRVKGFDLLIQSWRLLEKKYPQWKVILAGAGEEEKKLKKKAARAGLKRFHFAGVVTDIERYYEKAAFFVLPSRDEGFGMVLVEAMSYSTPVVSFDCKTGPGEIVEDGETGFLVEPENVTAFADKMEMLMTDGALRRKMGIKAGESVKRFDRERILDEWESLLGERMKRYHGKFGYDYCSGL